MCSRDPTPLSTSIATACLPLSRPLNHSYIGTASCRTTTPYICRDLRVPSAASTAVSSPCTWTEDIHRDNSSGSSLRRRPTGWSQTCSPLPLDPYEACPVEGSVVVVALRGAYIRPISYFTRNAYSSSYSSFFRFQRHLTLRSYTCVQRYIRVERLSSA